MPRTMQQMHGLQKSLEEMLIVLYSMHAAVQKHCSRLGQSFFHGCMTPRNVSEASWVTWLLTFKATACMTIMVVSMQVARAFRRKKMMAEVMGGGRSRQQLLNRHADRYIGSLL